MGSVYDEFVRELAAGRRRYAGHPRRELMRLFLLALEREELVSVGYREDLMLARLAAMPIPRETRELIHRALVWVWRDEAMHALYIRGAILKLHDPLLTARAFLRQAAGALGGWAGSVRQHVPWSKAPLARAAATLVTWAGVVAGQVPRDVRDHLRYRPFRDFCLFNVDAERTAEVCWQRIVELATGQADLAAALLPSFARVREDEERHGRVFAILAEALDGQDRPAEAVTADDLARRLGEVGEAFLPRARRARAASENPVGSGGPVWVAHGSGPAEKLPTLRRLLDDAGLAALLAERAARLGKAVGELRVAVKPSFMLGYHRKDLSPMTDAALLEELAVALRAAGCVDVAVVEGTNIYDRFYRNRSVAEVARYFGIRSDRYRLVDLAAEQVPNEYFRGVGQETVGRTWSEADFRITFGKMRSHPFEQALLTVGNLEWVGARCDEFVFVERQAQRETAVMMLVDGFPPHFALLDAYENVPDGLLGVMGCPRPRAVHRLYAGADALAVDVVAARHMGLARPRDSSMLREACNWFGDPSSALEVRGVDAPIPGWRGPCHDDLSAMLTFFSHTVYSVGSARGRFFVPEMDVAAFPPLEPESPALRLVRRVVRRLVGLSHPR